MDPDITLLCGYTQVKDPDITKIAASFKHCLLVPMIVNLAKSYRYNYTDNYNSPAQYLLTVLKPPNYSDTVKISLTHVVMHPPELKHTIYKLIYNNNYTCKDSGNMTS